VLGQIFRNTQAHYCSTNCYSFIPKKKKKLHDRERQGIKRRRTRNPPKTELQCNKGKTHISEKDKREVNSHFGNIIGIKKEMLSEYELWNKCYYIV